MDVYEATQELSTILGAPPRSAFCTSSGAPNNPAKQFTLSLADVDLRTGTNLVGAPFWVKADDDFLIDTIAAGSSVYTLLYGLPGPAMTVDGNAKIGDPRWPLSVLLRAINDAIYELGPYPEYKYVDTVDDQIAYAQVAPVFSVEVEQTLNAGDWVPSYFWTQANGEIRFDDGKAPAGGLRLRIGYEAEFPKNSFHYAGTEKPYVWFDEDIPVKFSEGINPRLVLYTAAVHAVRWRRQKALNDEPQLKDLWDEVSQKAAMYANRYPNLMPPKQPRLARY